MSWCGGYNKLKTTGIHTVDVRIVHERRGSEGLWRKSQFCASTCSTY